MISPIEICGRQVGPGQPCYIIAEAGVNHNGDLALAKRLVDAAKAAGADAVKFQTWDTDEIVSPSAAMADYQKENLGAEISQHEMLSQLELGHSAFREIQAHAEAIGITFLSTPDDLGSARFLHELGVPAFKIGSAELDNLEYLAQVAQLGKPMIVSTGMGDMEEVRRAVTRISETGNRQLILLHCVSNYPSDPASSNLRAIKSMADSFSVAVGYSDHSLGINVSLAAIALGACVIEKHLTLDRSMPGPDHAASVEPEEFARLVRGIREVESALGSGVKEPAPEELPTKALVRKVPVARRSLPTGHRIQEADLILRRASGGISALFRSALIGRVLKRPLDENAAVTLEHFQ